MAKVKVLVSVKKKFAYVTTNKLFDDMNVEEIRTHWLEDFQRPKPHQEYARVKMLTMLNSPDFDVLNLCDCEDEITKRNSMRKLQRSNFSKLGFQVLNKR